MKTEWTSSRNNPAMLRRLCCGPMPIVRRKVWRLRAVLIILLGVAVVLLVRGMGSDVLPPEAPLPEVVKIQEDTLAILRQRAWDAAMRYDSYLRAMLEPDDPKLARWRDRTSDPLRIYIPNGTLPGYTPEHRRAVLDAFGRWARVSGSVIPVVFTFVRRPERADVTVEWVATLPENKAGQAQLTIAGDSWIQDGKLLLAMGTPGGRIFIPEATYTIALHEIGHLLGLGHSDRSSDVMYPTTRLQDLSVRDRTTARLLYQIPPGRIDIR